MKEIFQHSNSCEKIASILFVLDIYCKTQFVIFIRPSIFVLASKALIFTCKILIFMLLQDSMDLLLGNYIVDENEGITKTSPLRTERDWKFYAVRVDCFYHEYYFSILYGFSLGFMKVS